MAARDFFEEVEKGIALQELPAKEDQEQPSMTAKFFFSVKEFMRKHTEDSLDKDFASYAKNTAIAYASAFNALNIACTSLSYIISDRKNRIIKHPHIPAVFLVLTMIFIPLSMITVGLASALENRMKWINWVAIMLMAEAIYMGVLCGFFAYYLIYFSTTPIIVILCVVGTVCIAFPAWPIFKRPDLCEMCCAK